MGLLHYGAQRATDLAHDPPGQQQADRRGERKPAHEAQGAGPQRAVGEAVLALQVQGAELLPAVLDHGAAGGDLEPHQVHEPARHVLDGVRAGASLDDLALR